MRAAWTGCGECISGSTAHRTDATRAACGGGVTTNTASGERRLRDGARRAGRLPTIILWRGGAAVRSQCRRDDRLVRIDVDNRHADAGRLDDVDDVDAYAGTDVVRRRRVVPRYVDADDDSDDVAVAHAGAVALSPRCVRP